LQELLGMLAAAAWSIVVDDAGRIVAAPAAIVTGHDPKIAGLGSAASRVEHRHGRLVHEELAGTFEVKGESIDDRLEVKGGLADP
jgi:hypothetical protein